MGTPFPAGMGTLFVDREGRTKMEVDGEDALDQDLRCVGWEYGSKEDKPIRLSTDNPSCSMPMSMQPDKQLNILDPPVSYGQ